MYIFMASQFFPLKDVMMEETFILYILPSRGPCPPACRQVSLSFSSWANLSAVTQPVSAEAESSSWVI